MKNKLTLSPKYKLYLRVLIVVISLLITAGGYLFYQRQADALRSEKYNGLKAIADLKESQIENWLHERNADAKVVAQSPFFIDGINRWLQDTGNVQLKEDITERLKPAQKEFGYENIFLAKTNGDLLLSATDSLVEINAFLKQKITETSVNREIVFTDFYLGQKENKIYFDIIAPIINSKNETVAVLIFRRDPNDFLYPLIQNWPTPGKSAETVILRVENDSVVFLNELRHRKNTALKLKIPLTRTEVPAVQAALGHTGLFEGIDYRGIKVLSDIRVIPGANWIMLAKVDKSEIYAGLQLTAGIIIGFAILLIMVCGIGFAFIYNSHQKSIYRELYSKEKELWGQQEKFKVTMDSLGEGIITLDIKGKVQYMNNLAEEMTGWNVREARGRELHDIYPVKNEETGQRENNILEKIYKQGIVKELANHTLLISKSGKEIPVMDTGAPIYDNDGTITGIVIAFQDETEKRKQRKIIEQSEVQLRSTLDNMMEGCQIISHDYSYLFINKAAEKHNRRPNAEFLGKNYMQMWPGIEATEVFHRIKETMEKRVYHHFENEFVFPDGTRGWFELHIQPVPEGIFILSQDVTERMIASRNLEEAHRRLQLASAAGKVALWNWDFANNTLEWTSLVDGMLGYDAGEFPRTLKAWEKIIHPDDFKDVDSLLNEHLEKKIPYEIEYRVFKKDGSLAWWHDSGIAECNSDGKPVAMSGVCTDITVQKLAGKQIAESEARYRNLVDNASVGVYETTTDGKVIFANKALIEMFGFKSLEESVSSPVLINYKNPKCREELIAELKQHGKVDNFEIEIDSRDGRELYILLNSKLNGNVLTGMIVDVTARKLAEEALRTSEERFRLVFENSGIGIALVDLAGHPIKSNLTLQNIVGYDEAELSSMSFTEFTHSEDAQKDWGLYTELVEGKRESYSMEKRYIRKDGQIVWAQLTVSLIRNLAGKPEYAIGIVEDITKRKLDEEEIRQNVQHIERLNRLLTMLSNINQLIVREKDTQKVLDEACRIAVEDGKFQLSWIAVPEENKSITLKAKSGRHDNYLGQLVLNLDAEENDKGITVFALTEKQHIICNDIEHDIVMHRYKDDALDCGFKSCASFPIFVSGKLYGAISLYSDVKNYFQPEEIKLLDETALDIGFAFETNEIGRQKSLAEEQLRESNERFNHLVSNLNDVVWSASIDGSEVLDINDSFESIYGISLEEYKNNPNIWMDVVHPHDRAIAEASSKELLEKGKSQAEYRIVRPDGRVVWLMDRKSLIYDSNGKAVQMGGIAKDITVRKLAEEKIWARAEDLGLINSLNYAINRGDKLDEIIGLMSKEIMRIFDCFGTITSFLNPDKSFLIPANIQFPSPLIGKLEKLAGDSLHNLPLKIALNGNGKIAGAMREGFPMAFNDADEIIEVMAEFTENNTLKRLAPSVFKLLHFRSMVLIPLVSENEIYGMLEIARAVQTSDEELNRFKVIAGQMTQAIGRKLAEEKVIDERNNATKYFETAGIILMILDKTGKVLKINKKGCDVLQYAVSEIVGKDWFEFIPANIAREVRSTFGQLMKGEIKEVEFYENPVVTRNGEERLIEWHNVILRDTEGKPVGTLSSGEDITAKKQNEKFLLAQRNLGISTSALTDLDELFRVSMESLLNVSGMECGMIYLFDEELKKLDMVFSKGLSEQFVLATSQYDEHSGNVKFVKSGNAAFVYYNELPVESGEIERAEKLVSVAMLPIVNKGTVIGCINLASHQDIPMPDSFQKGIEVIVTLISNAMVRISIEDEIRDLNASLEIKIKERTGQLALAKTEADRANVAKSEFLSRMSHELRTPMNSILGFAQLLNRSETNPESTKRIKQIIDSGKHLLDLINEVLDLAKIESGRLSLSLESVQLSGIITETLEIVSHLLKRER